MPPRSSTPNTQRLRPRDGADFHRSTGPAGIVGGHWPYGPNVCGDSRNRLIEWALAHSYRLADPRNECLHWLIGQARRCGALRDTSHPGRVDLGWKRSGLFDHVTCWTRDKKPALILAQPYSVDHDDVADVEREWPVKITVTGESPWYGHRTYGVHVAPSPEASSVS